MAATQCRMWQCATLSYVLPPTRVSSTLLFFGEFMKTALAWLTGLTCSLASLTAHASCGSASCSLATHVDGLGVDTNAGWQFDLRYEYIKLDQLRSGTQKIDPEYVDGEHTEIYTKNTNIVATIDYNWSNRWGFSVQLPYVKRDHFHIFDNAGTLEEENWDINSLGDVRILGRYTLESAAESKSRDGFQFGIKLATGKTDVVDAAGELAERTLQPGTGTTDIIVGYTHSHPMSIFDQSSQGFVQLQAQYAMGEDDGFRPGNQYRANVGVVFLPTASLSPIVQLNVLRKDRDSGVNAEPADSGAEYLWVSPGLSKMLSHSMRMYGFVQLPLYQRVNGVQLTADWTATIGLHWQL